LPATASALLLAHGTMALGIF